MDVGTFLGAAFTALVLIAVFASQRVIVSSVKSMLATSRAEKKDSAHEQLEARIGALEHRVAVTERYQISVLEAERQSPREK